MIRPEFVDDAIEETPEGSLVGHYGPFLLKSAFQPILDISDTSRTIIGYEGLIRPHLDCAIVSPTVFFPAIDEEDRFFIEWLCRALHLRNFNLFRRPGQQVFINLDPGSYIDLARSIREVSIMIERMATVGLTPADMVCEIVESRAASNHVLWRLARCFQEAGVTIAIDDFGAQWSDDRRIAAIHPDIVKLDRTWFKAHLGDASLENKARAVIDRFAGRGIRVVAEGIETERELDFARACEIPMAQGFYLGRPRLSDSWPWPARASRDELAFG
jgi:EAL domain-containing protein (putative c-di-GMP-specific phosphodiesterase class I)